MEITLRFWQKEDAPVLAGYANNPLIAQNLRDVFPSPYTKADAEFFIGLCAKADPSREVLLAVEAGGKLAGSIGLTLGSDIQRKSAELGYWIAQPYWGQGVATEAVRQMCRMGFEYYDIVRIWAQCFDGNTASQKVLLKNGFELEGRLRKSIYKNDQLQDALLYALIQE